MENHTCWSSGIARLGTLGHVLQQLEALGCAPPVEVFIRNIGADSIIVDHESSGKRFLNQTTPMFIHRITGHIRSPYASLPKYTALLYGLRTNPGGCKIQKKKNHGEYAPAPPKYFCTWRKISNKRTVRCSGYATVTYCVHVIMFVYIRTTVLTSGSP